MSSLTNRENIFFKDDINIIPAEISKPLNMPEPLPILQNDNLQIIYNGHLFEPSREEIPNAIIKLYTHLFGLKEISPPIVQEDDYFTLNKPVMDKIKEDFVKRTVKETKNNVIPLYITEIQASITEKITDSYNTTNTREIRKTPQTTTAGGKGNIAELIDGSIFNEYFSKEKVLVVDGKIYHLITIPEYLAKFKDSMKKEYYLELIKIADEKTPEEINRFMTDNEESIHYKAFSPARNKIWHSERSFKLFLDGTYWIPNYDGKTEQYINTYRGMVEKKIKMDAVKAIK